MTTPIPTVGAVLSRRQARDSGRLPRSAIGWALGIHLLIVALALIAPLLDGEPRRPLEFVPVRLVPARALGSEVAKPQPKPPPKAPERPQPKAPPPEPEVEPVAEEPAPQPAPQPPPRQPAPQQPTAAPPKPQPAPPPAPVDRQGSARGNPLGTSATLGANVATVDNPSFTYSYYLDRMLLLIEAQWRRPSTGQPVEALVHFRIRRDGRLENLEVVESSGSSSFDLAGLRAVQNAAPFPPLPAGYRSDSLGVNLVIR
ncbi:MAG: TonB family protein [Acidobacteriota bacterium]